MHFNFPLLSDPDRAIAEAYHALKEDGKGIQRSVYVVGRDGTIKFAQRGAPPPEEVVASVKEGGGGGGGGRARLLRQGRARHRGRGGRRDRPRRRPGVGAGR